MTKWLNNLQPGGALLMRLVLGWAMLYNGWDKVVPAGGFHGHNTFSAVDHFSRFVVSLGMPYWLGAVSAFTEFAGGLCLILGLFTRLFAFLITINMLVALVSVNMRHGYNSSAYTLSLIALAVMLVFQGPGALALDRKMGLS
jgi:putative oxidoreductase